MSDENQPESNPELVEEQRSMAADIALVATPLAILAQPVIGALANQHFIGKAENDQPAPPPPPPQEPPKQSQ